MIIVTAAFAIKPERWDDALQAVKELIAKSRRDEGCLRYDFYQNINEQYSLFSYEHWENPQLLQKHAQTQHLQDFLAFVQQAASRPMQLEKYEANEIK